MSLFARRSIAGKLLKERKRSVFLMRGITMAEVKNKTAMVVSAHSADFVWRAGGAIALYASREWTVKIVCLSFGERGESAKLWREGRMTLERVKALRRD